MKIFAIILFFFFLGSNCCPFPFYNQCDSQWGSLKLSWFKTMCESGSLYTSVSAMIKGYEVPLLNSEASTPSSLLEWMAENQFSTSFYDWKSISGLGFEYFGFQETEQLKKSITAGEIAFLYNASEDKWMMCHEFDDDGFIVHDPLLGALRHVEFHEINYGGVYKYTNKTS